MLGTSSSSGFRHGLNALIGRILDKAREKGTPLETFKTALHFFYGQDLAFCDLYVSTGFGSYE